MPEDLFAGLNALAESAFPKLCRTCGREFATVEQYLRETESLRAGASGLKQSEDDDGKVIVEVYRNCPCGSTLMDFFGDRRDLSPRGLERRERFESLLAHLESQGLERGVARVELLKVLHGQGSDLLREYAPPPQGGGSSG